jgi:cell division protein FtsQ
VSTRTAEATPDDEVMEARVVRHWPKRWFIAIGVVAALAVLAYGATRSPFLDVDQVKVQGAHRTQDAQLLAAAGVAKGDPLVWLDTAGAVSGLEALPYVKSAKVTKEWPDTVRIVVIERSPAGWAEGPTGNVLVDGTGRVLDVVKEQPAGIPKLVGLTAVPAPGASVTPTGPARAAGVLNPLAAAGTASITAADGGLTMQLANGVEVRLGDGTQLRAKVAAATAVLGAMNGQPVTYVDVSVPTNPVAG